MANEFGTNRHTSAFEQQQQKKNRADWNVDRNHRHHLKRANPQSFNANAKKKWKKDRPKQEPPINKWILPWIFTIPIGIEKREERKNKKKKKNTTHDLLLFSDVIHISVTYGAIQAFLCQMTLTSYHRLRLRRIN